MGREVTRSSFRGLLLLAVFLAVPGPAGADLRAPVERHPRHEVPAAPGGGQVVPQGIIIPGFRVNAATAQVRVVEVDETSATYLFTGTITVAGKGIVRYRWIRSNNPLPPVESVVFDGSGTKSVTSRWQLGLGAAPHEAWKVLQIEEPNKLRSNEVRVTVPQRGFRVTRVDVTVAPGQAAYAGPCPTTFTFNGTISVEGSGTVKYRWVRSDGGKGPVKELSFGWVKSFPVEAAQWKRDGAPGSFSSGWMNLEILYPNVLYPPGEGMPTAVYGSPTAYRFTMKCESSSTPRKLQLKGWSSGPFVTYHFPFTWRERVRENSPGEGYHELHSLFAKVKVRNASVKSIPADHARLLVYSARTFGAWDEVPPPAPGDLHCYMYDRWVCLDQPFPLDLAPGQETEINLKSTIAIPVEWCSGWPKWVIRGKTLVYLVAVVYDPEAMQLTRSEWLRWALPEGNIDSCR
jgi:hypothetical protein